jgi:AcrR family transcriptional regulator
MTQAPGAKGRTRVRALSVRLKTAPIELPTLASNAPDRILAAAETLFATRGFDISLREITELAQVNIAAVNYHFGSKTNLTEVLFDRVSQEINGKRLEDLERLMVEAQRKGRPPELDGVILAFIKPYLDLSAGGHLLARLILQHRIEPSDLTRQIVKTHFDPMAKRFIEAFRLALPSVDPTAFFWRYVFMVGAVVLTVTDSGPGNRLDRLSQGAADATRKDDFQKALLAFLRAGLSALDNP